jgi:hypothetical protein
MITENQIGRELVLVLDPDILEEQGGAFTCAPAFRVQGEHFFLCIYADEEEGKWIPMYSNFNFGRIAISLEGRLGHPKWVEGAWHYHPAQIWTAPHSAVVAAAESDLSEDGARNLLDESQFPYVP